MMDAIMLCDDVVGIFSYHLVNISDVRQVVFQYTNKSE